MEDIRRQADAQFRRGVRRIARRHAHDVQREEVVLALPRPGLERLEEGGWAEEEARHRARLLETAMGSMRHGLVVYGPDRRVIAANDLAGELAEIVGRYLATRNSADVVEGVVSQHGERFAFDQFHREERMP